MEPGFDLGGLRSQFLHTIDIVPTLYEAIGITPPVELNGIAQKMELEPEMRGDMYRADGIREIPKTLREAAELLHGSAMLRAAFGDAVVEHYTHAARWEVAGFDRVVTDWEVRRGLERA